MNSKSYALLIILIFSCAMAIVMSSCGSRGTQEDSKEVAEDKNDEKFDVKANEKDAQFVVDAVSDSYAEIHLAELAQTRAVDDEVKTIAGDLKTYYSDMLEKFKSYASSKAISIPTAETDKIHGTMESLAAEKTFDKKWSNEVRDLSKGTIERFENAESSLSDTELKTLASTSLTEIRKKHDKIMSCNNRLK